MNEDSIVRRTFQILPWLLVLILGGLLALEKYGTDRYKLTFGTYPTAVEGGGTFPRQGLMRIDSKTGRTWILTPLPYKPDSILQDQRWLEVLDPR